MCNGILRKVVLSLILQILFVRLYFRDNNKLYVHHNNINYGCTHLIDNLIASAPNTGSIVLWDLNSKAAKNKIGKHVVVSQLVQRILVLL